ncbi:SxtJ family membrane protein [Ruegeria arenilitoris]|uniref:SxtJ family membrane protein n=1 Tax=Ruegeria arenilitoris TaxID=1173585 RepID=UPI003C7E6302
MSDHTSNVSVKMGSERNFGVVFAIVFAIIAFWPLTSGGGVRIWAIVVAIVFFALAFFVPKSLKWPNRLWFKFGLLLGAIIAPIVMALVFLTTFLTIGLLLRMSGKDLLGQKLDPEAESYWTKRTDIPTSMKNQF